MPFAARGGFTFVASVEPVGPQLWTPADDANTLIWIDASDASTITESSGYVSQWDNKADGGTTYFAQATGSYQPYYDSANSAVKFDGVDDDMRSGTRFGEPAAPGYYIFGVISNWAQPVANTSKFAQIGLYTYSTGWTAAALYTGSQPAFTVRYNNGAKRWSNAYPLNTKVLVAFGHPTSGNYGSAVFFKDGTAGTFYTNTNATYTRSDTANEFIIGAGANYTASPPTYYRTEFNKINIYEMVYMTDHTDSTRQKVEGYLAWKWGLEDNLPAGHPYKSGAPTT